MTTKYRSFSYYRKGTKRRSARKTYKIEKGEKRGEPRNQKFNQKIIETTEQNNKVKKNEAKKGT